MRGVLRASLLTSAAGFAAIQPQIDALRRQCGALEDVSLDPRHFLASTSREQRPCSVACWRGEELIGVLFCMEQWKWGIKTGYAVGGDFTGRGLLLCLAEHESLILDTAVPALIEHGNHSLHLRRVPRTAAQLNPPGFRVRHLEKLIRGDRMSLGRTYEEFLASLGQHTRRNFRYYRRKTIEAGMRFDPDVGREEFLEERNRLNAFSQFPIRSAHLERVDRLTALHGGGRRMALRAADGRVIALLCAFSLADRFYLLTQWNDRSLDKLSLSNVLRGYAIEFLIEHGYRELIFIFGTSIALGRFCVPQRFELVLLDRARGLSAVVKRMLARLCRRMADAGKPLLFPIEGLAGGFLDTSLLVVWTALSQDADPASTPGTEQKFADGRIVERAEGGSQRRGRSAGPVA